jgi:uncharacterized membrane protein YphA (DoxX/SURF4 family)
LNANIELWVVQIIVALIFLGTGILKLLGKKDSLGKVGMAMPETVSKGIGAIEVLGGFGIVLPELLGILPWLSPLAALGLAATMVGATLANLHYKDYRGLVLSLPLLIACGFVAWGRFILVPV